MSGAPTLGSRPMTDVKLEIAGKLPHLGQVTAASLFHSLLYPVPPCRRDRFVRELDPDSLANLQIPCSYPVTVFSGRSPNKGEYLAVFATLLSIPAARIAKWMGPLLPVIVKTDSFKWPTIVRITRSS